MSTSRPYNSSYNLVQPSRVAVSQTGKLPINRQKYPISQSKPLGQNELANSSSQSSLKQNEEGGVKDEQFSDDLRENIKAGLNIFFGGEGDKIMDFCFVGDTDEQKSE